ncbi:MAG: tRNA pseudouridine(55) synthase TruB [Pseudomonadota bacterium]|nr:tRNA pseudouridine(55) synthase TruB [Pseudomonadota bacterium]
MTPPVGKKTVLRGALRRKKGIPVHGWIILDKPPGLTSAQAVARVRKAYDAQKCGHAGTLDPMATGVLPIALGEATKTTSLVTGDHKSYGFRIRWGESTDTLDAEGNVIAKSDARPSQAAIEAALPGFVGDVPQIPPDYSAIKVDGKRAYDLARSGKELDLSTRIVHISRLSLIGVPDSDHADFELDCGKGCYIRAVARDLAALLGVCGHVVRLRRTAVGAATAGRAVSLDAIEGEVASRPEPLSIQTMLDGIPALALSEEEAGRLRQGRTVALLSRDAPKRLEQIKAARTAPDATVLAVCRIGPVALVRLDGPRVVPIRVFNLS